MSKKASYKDARREINSKEVDEQMINSCDDQEEETMIEDLRRGTWTAEEDMALMNYISHHGEGRWNSLAHSAGLKRTGKSCRLRWLNYLRPDVRRGDITLEEQLMILELHSHWGNRWSKIAQQLPGRTDNEIKNYWRTRVQKHAKQLKCDVNSKQFKDFMRYVWMPRLVERIQAARGDSTGKATTGNSTFAKATDSNDNINNLSVPSQVIIMRETDSMMCDNLESMVQSETNNPSSLPPENISTTASLTPDSCTNLFLDLIRVMLGPQKLIQKYAQNDVDSTIICAMSFFVYRCGFHSHQCYAIFL
ncbi:hypothetical protein DCAR_0935372 [Daucus carota subsp. sativus]|uniref:Uncharacterized protein n=1 Tax=Daucus carota subsp. sativus TaxID=79200 RepID=A0A175YGY1_DAUCS|nr:PREDICTED: transcription factor MYB108-like [Daucus carota subsp. sativus]WOH15826.1 hypothetical protein DCAR_0935372 [Daucus carota subsp. sativus]